LTLAASAVACSGEAGPAGAQGDRGERGAPGADGTDGTNGANGTDGKDGSSATVDPSLSPIEKAFVAAGGKDAISKLTSYSYTAKGSRAVDGEGYLPGDPAFQTNSFEATVRYDIAANNLRIDHDRTVYFGGAATPQKFSEIIKGNVGVVDGLESVFMFPTGDMTSSRAASTRRQQRFLNPHLFLRDAAADATLVSDGGLALHDGSLHHLVVIEDAIHPVTLYVNAATGRIAKASTIENDYLYRDRQLEAHYIGWEPTASGVLFPKQVAISLGETILHNEVRDVVDVNVAIDSKTFDFPAGAMPMFDADDAHRGEQSHQFHQNWSSFGIPLDAPQVFVQPQMIAQGVYHLLGGTHNSLVIEQTDGLVLVDAPLYEERSEAILAWMKAQFPTKPVKHLIISHHHQDHSAGARSILPEGVDVTVGAATAEFFRGIFEAPSTVRPDALAMKPTKATIHAVPTGGSYTLADATRPVTAYHVKSTHSADLLMVHVANEQIVFIVDIYSPGSPVDPAAAKELHNAITVDYGINVATFAGGHGATSTFAEFLTFVP
jgi:glyoxylase-like metal-dependent hydrolase (beta-lactamase superfamily II)